MNFFTLLLFSGFIWVASAILVILAALSSATYIALAFRYFRRSHKFTLPPKSKWVRFELTAPAFFVFFTGIGSVLALVIAVTFGRSIVGAVPGGLMLLALVCLILGAAFGLALHVLLTFWGKAYIDRFIEKYDADKNELMQKYLSPSNWRR